MKKELFQEVEIPQGIEANLDGTKLTIKGPEGENVKEFKIGKLDMEMKDNKIVIGNKKATKTDKRLMNTIAAHIRNMIKGAGEKFEYKLKICFSHFPITVDVKEKEAVIKNFLGEKIPRKCKIVPGVKVDIDKEFITVTSQNKELAGQVAANFEMATKVGNRDRRVFQDGIFMISKCGVEI
ncbi:MAG: 50S ribosomal protein L6 [Candidatus Pacearchaeota archaeon]|nr:50S ribosomal protein L6 [Candidatus Pacearchaeota archaeon]